MSEEKELKQEAENQEEAQAAPPVRKKWFGRGIYGSKDVPIKILDRVIFGFVAAIILLTVIFAINGGYMVYFDTDGGTAIESQKLRYGEKVAQPMEPVKAGYVFDGWYLEGTEPLQKWDFAVDNVGGEITLLAGWRPAEITVKFDLNGGRAEGETSLAPLTVRYQEPYGSLPVPEKEGAEFSGWLYSGEIITEDTIVSMTGEHVLTAQWE